MDLWFGSKKEEGFAGGAESMLFFAYVEPDGKSQAERGGKIILIILRVHPDDRIKQEAVPALFFCTFKPDMLQRDRRVCIQIVDAHPPRPVVADKLTWNVSYR